MGTRRVQQRQLVRSGTRRQEDIGLEESGKGRWSLAVYDVRLARRDARDFKLYA
jgi:hypothetical protein